MSLPVPLTVRVGTSHITAKVAGLSFRKEAVGGVANITLSLNAPLSSFAVTALDDVYVFDARTAETVAQGRIADPGRNADANSGQTWSVAAFGPATHAGDDNRSLVYIDQSLTDGWRRVRRGSSAGGQVDQSTKPGNTADNAAECIVAQFAQGKNVDPGDELCMRYERLREAEMKLARFSYTWDVGVTDANYSVDGVPRTDGNTATVAATNNFNTAGGTVAKVVVTDWPNGRNTLDLRASYNGGAATNPANDKYWGAFSLVVIRGMLLDKDGTDITTGYSQDYVRAYEVVKDLLGRCLPQFDGANASVDTTATYNIGSLCYPDGISPREVLDDLMALEPAYYWTTGPATSTGKFSFSWLAWPTTVRYEATLEDGGDFPTSTQELYNYVTVRWRDKRGRSRQTKVTGTCPILDAKGIVRRAIIDIGDEFGTDNNATQVGTNFLAEHKYPPNAGTLNVARPIRDLYTGRMVDPHEIEPGNLIRVRGVESYPDALNASSNDGQTVFRIWAMSYSSDSATAALELDTYPRTTAQALARLQKRRERKR